MYTCAPYVHKKQKRMLDPLGLELQMIVSFHLGIEMNPGLLEK